MLGSNKGGQRIPPFYTATELLVCHSTMFVGRYTVVDWIIPGRYNGKLCLRLACPTWAFWTIAMCWRKVISGWDIKLPWSRLIMAWLACGSVSDIAVLAKAEVSCARRKTTWHRWWLTDDEIRKFDISPWLHTRRDPNKPSAISSPGHACSSLAVWAMPFRLRETAEWMLLLQSTYQVYRLGLVWFQVQSYWKIDVDWIYWIKMISPFSFYLNISDTFDLRSQILDPEVPKPPAAFNCLTSKDRGFHRFSGSTW